MWTRTPIDPTSGSFGLTSNKLVESRPSDAFKERRIIVRHFLKVGYIDRWDLTGSESQRETEKAGADLIIIISLE